MPRLRSLLAAASLSLLAAAQPAQAQVPLLDVRLGAHAVMPTGDLGDAFDTGFGIYGRVGAPMGPMKLMGSLSWNQFKGANDAIDDVNVIAVSAGPHFSMVPLFDFGLELAYFSEFEELGIQPNISLNLMRFDLTASYNTTFDSPQASWLTLGGGIRF
jgi:hypothetical protein